MHSPCIREASRACFHGCCLNPFLGLPEHHDSTPKDSAPNPRYDFIAATVFSLGPNTHFTNHESLPSLAQSFSNLNKAYPKYADTDKADQVRTQEYYHLSLSNHVCLDYTGHCLFSYSQQLHCDAPFFNVSYKPVNLYAQLLHGGQESEFESIVKKRIMSFMNISTDDYTLVFTANQLSAFKLLGDSYSFQTNRKLLTVYDHENEAVEAMIGSSKKRGAKAISAEFSWPNMRIHSRKLRKMVLTKKKKKKKGLFVFPLQSKVTGARYSYLWMSVAQENGWHVCLDASALGTKDMETLGLSLFQPDFLICSFYKVFGENPSGFGCLFVKKSRASVLSNSGTSLGVVSLVPATKQPLVLENSAIADLEQETAMLELKKEDRAMASPSSFSSISDQNRNEEIQETEEITGKQRQRQLSFSEIMELDRSFENSQTRKSEASGSGSSETEFRSLDQADSLGLILISSRARYLVNWLLNALTSLQHPHSENGLPLVKIYGPKVRLDRGPAVAFNIFDWKGEKVDPTLVQKLADRNNISLSYATLKHIMFSDKNQEESERLTEEEGNLSKLKREKLGISIPVITASLGFLTNFEDTYRLWAFVSRFLDADFVEKERWRYMALNRTTVEV